MPRIRIVTGAHLCRNPRVDKEASALRAAGHGVDVVTTATTEALATEDAALAEAGGYGLTYAVDLRPSGLGAARQRHRAVRRLAAEAVARLGWQRPEALGYGVRTTLAAALRQPADLTIGHQEVGAWVAAALARRGLRVGVDLEDWYSRDLLPDDRQRLPVRLLVRLEGGLLRACRHATTTSASMAEALAEAYDAPRPTVVYNAFPWAEREALDDTLRDRPDRDRPSLHWVSQTIGPGRGLSTLATALDRVTTPVDVHLRGRADTATRRWLGERFPADGRHRLFVHDLVPPSDLLGRIAEHDVGLALEPAVPDNKAHTVSNKILHYLVGGLAVVATDTPGQAEVAAGSGGAVSRVPPGDAGALGAAIDALAGDPGRLLQARADALKAARERYCWEAQVPALLDSVHAALDSPRPTGFAL